MSFQYVTFDVSGAITGGHRVYGEERCGDFLRERGIRHVAMEFGAAMPRRATHIVDGGTLYRRPVMQAVVDKTCIRCDGRDAAVVRGLPRGCKVSVARNGIIHPGWDDVALDDGELEIAATQPGRYRATVTKWPYQDLVVEIEATA